jgi:hypothetical protein
VNLLPGLQWTAPVDTLVGTQIVEIDMVSAGMTVIRIDGLVPPDVLARLEAMPKRETSVAVGKLSRTREHAGLSGAVTEGIRRRMELILLENGYAADEILAVKRDAVYVVGRSPSRLVLPDGTAFKIKGAYNAFARLGNVEVYAVPRRGTADVKGMDAEDADLHRPFILRMVLDFLAMVAAGRVDEAASTLARFRSDYVRRLLPVGFYREFGASAGLQLRTPGGVAYQVRGAAGIPIDELDIAFNVRNVIVPLARSIA